MSLSLKADIFFRVFFEGTGGILVYLSVLVIGVDVDDILVTDDLAESWGRVGGVSVERRERGRQGEDKNRKMLK